MSFWKKIFGTKKEVSKQQGDPLFAQYRVALNALNLKTAQDLEWLVEPLIRPATIIEVAEASKEPDHSPLKSHFGGRPYFQENDKWPTTKSAQPLSFVFQIFNEDDLILPKEIALIQFFYEWDIFPFETSGEGWFVKIYKQLDIEKLVQLPRPKELEETKHCEISFKETKSLPDWEGIEMYNENASNLSCVLNEKEPWLHYDEAVTKLLGEQDFQSQLGGYPQWIQGEGTPKDKQGNAMKLLFQIASEGNADLIWGDSGIIYVFYDEANGHVEFKLQSH